jgi:hypothetical protein
MTSLFFATGHGASTVIRVIGLALTRWPMPRRAQGQLRLINPLPALPTAAMPWRRSYVLPPGGGPAVTRG